MKAVQKDTGKVGFSRELFDYSFNYTLPINEWVELEFKNQQNKMELYVNGKLVDALGDDERIEGRTNVSNWQCFRFQRLEARQMLYWICR